MYEEFYERIPDAEAYKERIGLGGVELRADKESLDRIVASHLTHIAFENMDSWSLGLCPDLRIGFLFDKIVTRRRGGWCFELNSLLNAFLRELGFETYMVGAFVVAGGDELRPPAHCCIVVKLGNEKYFCDVGYGGPVPQCALNMNGESAMGFHIRREGIYTQVYNEMMGYVAVQFKDVPQAPVELVPNNFYISQISTSPFRNELHINLRFHQGSVSINESEFKLSRPGEKIEKTLDYTELPEILEKYFNINPDGINFRPFGPNPI